MMEQSTRKQIAAKYIQGYGIEIGALHQPLQTSTEAKVSYVDRLSVPELRLQYPELKDLPLVPITIIDDGETLQKIKDASQDFVIANHFLEHCQDPIGAIEHFVRVLKPGGIIYLALPDKRFTFDRDRPVTSLSHLIQDHAEGPARSEMNHFREWSVLVDHADEEHAQELKRIGYSIHFHVWTEKEMREMMSYIQHKMLLKIKHFQINDMEVIIILKKLGIIARLCRRLKAICH